VAVGLEALSTLANVKSVLGVSDSGQDALICQYIDRASDDIQGLTDRKLKARRYNGNTMPSVSNVHPTTAVPDEDYIFINGKDAVENGRVFYLPQFPIQANTVVPFQLSVLSGRDSLGESWDDAALVEWQDFIIERDTGLLRLLRGGFSHGHRNYRVTCAAGYQVGSAQPFVPPRLEGLCVQMVKKLFWDSDGVTQESLGTWSKSFDPDKQNEMIDAGIAQFRRL
jgi:hypothetical protein